MGHWPRLIATPCTGAVPFRIVAVVGRETAETALAALRRVAPRAALIGEFTTGAAQVVLDTAFGGQRSLDELEDDPLPRIC
jgi:hydrogenase expression/formation protein HypE